MPCARSLRSRVSQLRLLPARLGLRQYAYPLLADPARIDWVDYAARNRRASPARYAQALLDRAADHTVWFVWSGGYRTYGLQCERVIDELNRKDRVKAHWKALNDQVEKLGGVDRAIFAFLPLERLGELRRGRARPGRAGP